MKGKKMYCRITVDGVEGVAALEWIPKGLENPYYRNILKEKNVCLMETRVWDGEVRESKANDDSFDSEKIAKKFLKTGST